MKYNIGIIAYFENKVALFLFISGPITSVVNKKLIDPTSHYR